MICTMQTMDHFFFILTFGLSFVNVLKGLETGLFIEKQIYAGSITSTSKVNVISRIQCGAICEVRGERCFSYQFLDGECHIAITDVFVNLEDLPSKDIATINTAYTKDGKGMVFRSFLYSFPCEQLTLKPIN